ncbi:hypothetical protein VP1G_08987 [Cytospora mali]|uniref:WSC domain-containing protein n=1 Tax=Cytospora mali TaxID=578113 RepID=A0A194VDI6_CYTMA|nr:hypothetical protein VP1G_08987 [Valsa mali var. pyri (nom. inval.)]
MGTLQRLAVGTVLLALGVRAQYQYQGCVALSTTKPAAKTDIYPQGPTPCANYCNGLGLPYMGITAQYCSCWATAPSINKTYTNSNNNACSFNCDDPYSSLYCGGIDVVTLNFLYSYYAIPGKAAASSVAPQASSSNPKGGASPTVAGGSTRPAATSASRSASVTLVPVPGSPGSSTLVTVGSSPSTTTAINGPVATMKSLLPAESFVISVERFLRNAGDRVLSYQPAISWLHFTSSNMSFWGIVPPNQVSGTILITVTAGQQTRSLTKRETYTFNIGLVITTPEGSGPPPNGGGGPGGQPPPGPPPPGSPGAGGGGPGGPPPPGPPPPGSPGAGGGGPGGQPPPGPPPPGSPGAGGGGPGGQPPPGPPPPGSPGAGGPGGPGGPFGPGGPNGSLSYTNTVYQDVTSVFTRCPICEAETTVVAWPIGTTCVPAQLFTTPCEVTTTRSFENGECTTEVYTTNRVILYNPAESTTVVSTVQEYTKKVLKTFLVAVTTTVQVAVPTSTAENSPESEGTGASGNSPEAAGPAAPGPVATGATTPQSGGNGSPASGGSQAAPGGNTSPGSGNVQANSPYATAGATRFGSDMLVETFVLLAGMAFGVVLLL